MVAQPQHTSEAVDAAIYSAPAQPTLYLLPARTKTAIEAEKTDAEWDEQSPASAFKGIKREVKNRLNTIGSELVIETYIDEDERRGIVGVRCFKSIGVREQKMIEACGLIITDISEGKHTFCVKLEPKPTAQMNAIPCKALEPLPTEVRPMLPPLPIDEPDETIGKELYRQIRDGVGALLAYELIAGAPAKPDVQSKSTSDHLPCINPMDAKYVGGLAMPKYTLRVPMRTPLGQRVLVPECSRYMLASDTFWYRFEIGENAVKWFAEDDLKVKGE